MARNLRQKWHGQKNECHEDLATGVRTGGDQQPPAGAAHCGALSGAASTACAQSPAEIEAANCRSDGGTTGDAARGQNHTHWLNLRHGVQFAIYDSGAFHQLF